mgnify:CR=1 FL=1
MIHDQSSTGSTVFVEPMAVVKLNNELRELEIQEQTEIEKILAGLSETAAESLEMLDDDLKVLTQLDFIFAGALLAKARMQQNPFSTQRALLTSKRDATLLLKNIK